KCLGVCNRLIAINNSLSAILPDVKDSPSYRNDFPFAGIKITASCAGKEAARRGRTLTAGCGISASRPEPFAGKEVGKTDDGTDECRRDVGTDRGSHGADHRA